MDRVRGAVPTAHPGYFYAAKKSVGNNSPDIAAKKLAYYEYFYGTGTPESYGYADKQAGNTQAPNSYHGAVKGNEQGRQDNIGFKDPHGKYPLKRYHNEPETNRLARGVVRETVVALKQSKRTIGVPVANNGGTWNQPDIPYGAKYPYNHVRETESGHIQEFDDTPGYERVHTYHRSGTFQETDANGTMVTKVVGDGYIIYDRNGYISIEGTANVTVAGNINIYCRSDANIEVAGSAEMKVGGNFDIGVARDMNIAVEGNFSLWANGAMNLQSKKKGHILAVDNLYVASSKEMHVQSTSDMFIQSKKNADIKVANNLSATAGERMDIKAGDNIKASSDQNVHIVAGESQFISAGNNMHIVAGSEGYYTTGSKLDFNAAGNINADAPNIYMNSGTSSDGVEGTEADEAKPAIKALIHGMVPPPVGIPLNVRVEPLTPPPMHGEEKFMYELPEDGQTQASKQYNEERTAQEGKSNTFETEKDTATGGGGTSVVSSRQNEILATKEFTADFKLSQHFTLGMMFDGGFNVRHKLIDQNGLTKQQIVANLAALCENILEKYLSVLPDGIKGYNKSWKIGSGYRMGTNTSDHTRGRAVDISLIGGADRKERTHKLIKELDKIVPYDQIILEYEGQTSCWIHTSFRGTGNHTFGGGVNRKMAFTMNNHKTYSQGFTLLA